MSVCQYRSRDLTTAGAVPVIVAGRSKVRKERQVEVQGAIGVCVASVNRQASFVD